ncbi:MAG: GcvT family protein [Chloroflexota bacterium]|nr:MAG: GcvT family protein [Chloroflexota bacterium]
MTENITQGNFPTQAQVVVIGGGVIGCSVAYHLTKLGWQDVLLLERSKLTSGTTWHAAGLIVSGGFGTETTINMAKYTRELYTRLGKETGQDTGFSPVGYLEVASNAERVEGLRRQADFARGYGIDVEQISPAEVKKLWPLMYTDDLLAGFFNPLDGVASPVDTTMALAKGARMGGARILEETRVTGILKEKGRVTGVVTDQGTIAAEYVVNCCGIWSREVGKMAGVNVPLHASEHYYLVTEPIEGVHPGLPVVEDPELYLYLREETGGLMVGMFEPEAKPWGMNGIPDDFSFGEIPPDWDHLMPYLERAMKRIPIAKEAGVHLLFCGPESFTPDMSPMIGEAPELRNFYVAAGFNSLGILLGGGVGQVIAQWIVDGYPPVDISEINIERMSPFRNNPKYLYDRTVEMLGWQYAEGWSNLHFESARGARRTPFHDRLAEAGAMFGESDGWEYADWYAPPGVKPHVDYSWKRQNWFSYNAAEHKAAREGVIVMDLTPMSKFHVQGRDAQKVLNHISARDVDVEVGRCVYTTWLNERGTIEADLTVARLAEDRYQVVSSWSIHTNVLTWLKRHIPEDAHVTVTDMTSAYSLLNIQGPKSRQLLSKLTSADMSNQTFPYLTIKEIDIGYALVNALRITYLGELGWELYIPSEFSLHVYDFLLENGIEVGLKHAGLHALETLRMEKAYRDYGHDIDNLDTPLEVGLGFTVDPNKSVDFIGKEAFLKQKESGLLKRRLVQFLLEDPEPLLHGGEPIYRDGVRVGDIHSGNYGHTLGGAIGLGPVRHAGGVTKDFLQDGQFEIEVVGVRYPAKASLRPMYDPKNEKVKR